MSALRLALFTPVPPAGTGVATYASNLLPLLPGEWDIEVFTDGAVDGSLASRSVHQIEAWEGRDAAAPFDLNIYQVGNNAHHLTTLPFVTRHPGLLVLHDAVLHPTRAAAFLADDDIAGYRRVLKASVPEFADAVADVVAAGLGGPALYWNFPLCEDLIRASRHTVVHGEMLARWLAAQVPGTDIGCIPLWLPVPECGPARVERWRAELGANAEAPLLGTFGHLGAEHRVDLILETLGELVSEVPFRLVIVGTVDPGLKLEAMVKGGPLAGCTRFTGRVSDADFGALLRAVDLGLNLRYPSARAASGPLAQLMTVGTPVVIHDLVHQRDIPEPAVLRVPTGPREEEKAALRAVLVDWLQNEDLRARASAAAARWGARHVTPEALRAGYETAVERALAVAPVA